MPNLYVSLCFHRNSLSFNMNTFLQYILKGDDVVKTLYHVCVSTSGHGTICDSHETNDAPVLVKPAVKQQHPQRSVAIARGTEIVGGS